MLRRPGIPWSLPTFLPACCSLPVSEKGTEDPASPTLATTCHSEMRSHQQPLTWRYRGRSQGRWRRTPHTPSTHHDAPAAVLASLAAFSAPSQKKHQLKLVKHVLAQRQKKKNTCVARNVCTALTRLESRWSLNPLATRSLVKKPRFLRDLLAYRAQVDS